METPLIDAEVLLERFNGKGGWTFIRLPNLPKSQGYFGMRKVRGFIEPCDLDTMKAYITRTYIHHCYNP